MQSTDSTDSATMSRPTGHPDSERCPGNLCAHVSSPSFKNADEKEDVDSILHNFCNNCPSQAEQEPLCNFCRHLRLRHLAICLRDKLTYLHIDLDLDSNTCGSGISRILLNKGCVLCSLLANSIHSYFAMAKKHEEDEKSMQAKISLSLLLKQEYGTRSLVLRLHGPNGTDEIEIAYREPSEDSIRTVGGRIDWPTVQQWFSRCSDYHDCKRLEPLTMPEGFHLIDVNNWNLVSDFPSDLKVGHDIKFVALSYVWGKQHISRNDALLASNKDELTTPGGLKKISLPKAIKDAITICQQLHYRFLWVDRFCIQQDDKGPRKQTQINAMGDIYSSAEFTIIHASGSSFEDPIAGVTVTRKVLQSKTVTCGLELISGYPDIKVAIKASKWSERGWTYQEAVLSRRKLFFTPFELWFECSNSYAPYQREEQCSSERRQGPSVNGWDKAGMTQFGINNFAESTTQFEDFVRHIESYTARSLTYPLDVLNAFMGILTTLYKANLGIYGLPETDFDQALLWYCKTEQMPKTDNNSFPSWSWASVSKIVTAPTIQFNEGFLGPLVQWSYKDQNGELKTVRSWNSLHSRDRNTEDTQNTRDTHDKPDTNAQAHLLVAWWKGCIEPAVPEDVKQELEKCSPACESSNQTHLPFIERVWGHIEKAEKCATCESKIAQRWPDLKEVWKSIKRARNFGIWDTQYLTERLSIGELQPGVLLTRAQTAYFKVSLEVGVQSNGPFTVRAEIYLVDSEGQRIGIVRPEYTYNAPMTGVTLKEVLGIKAGTAKTDSLECMGISLSNGHKLASSKSTSLDSDRNLKYKRILTRILQDIQSLPKDPTDARQPAVNVLVIHREGGSKGSPFARRIGVGWVYLADWMKADRVFKTICLK
ncbi:HET-domain-containing protein [Xylaria scruposa]|nr:HET-domain-containing protein [Xylaria scruposa]